MRQGCGIAFRADKREAPQRGARGASLGSVGGTTTGEGRPRRKVNFTPAAYLPKNETFVTVARHLPTLGLLMVKPNHGGT
jgi:hypothetical protein